MFADTHAGARSYQCMNCTVLNYTEEPASASTVARHGCAIAPASNRSCPITSLPRVNPAHLRSAPSKSLGLQLEARTMEPLEGKGQLEARSTKEPEHEQELHLELKR